MLRNKRSQNQASTQYLIFLKPQNPIESKTKRNKL